MTSNTPLGALADAALDLLLPRRCAGCSRPATAWCPDCARSFGAPFPIRRSTLPPALPVFAVAAYQGPARRAVLAAKERGRRELLAVLAAALAAALPALTAAVPALTGPLWLVPAPSRAAASRRRGGPHMTAIAEHVARLCATGTLVRPTPGAPLPTSRPAASAGGPLVTAPGAPRPRDADPSSPGPSDGRHFRTGRSTTHPPAPGLPTADPRAAAQFGEGPPADLSAADPPVPGLFAAGLSAAGPFVDGLFAACRFATGPCADGLFAADLSAAGPPSGDSVPTGRFATDPRAVGVLATDPSAARRSAAGPPAPRFPTATSGADCRSAADRSGEDRPAAGPFAHRLTARSRTTGPPAATPATDPAASLAARAPDAPPPVRVARPLRLTLGARDSVGLTAADRADNLRAHLTVLPGSLPPPGAAVVLLDDVITTGATAAACARVLRDAGTRVLAVLACTAAV